MDPSTITAATFTLQQGTTPVAGTVNYTGTMAAFSPSAPLAPNTLFTATITTGAKDLAGNALAGNYVWNFTTGATPDTTPPTVNSTVPATGTTGVSTSSSLAATFSEPMDPSTITAATFTLQQGTTPIQGTVNYSGTTATFSPAATLAPNATFFVEQVAATYNWNSGDTTPDDGWLVLAPLDGGSGRWKLVGEQISLSPGPSATDDWVALFGAGGVAAACAYRATIILRPGTWKCNSAQQVPNGTTLIGSPGVSIVSTLPVSPDGHSNTPFFADNFSYSPTTTTLTVDVVQGSNQITVASGTALVVNQAIALVKGNNIWVASYTVMAISGNVVTVERPIFKPFTRGDNVVVMRFASDISILGNGMTLSGTGDRGVQIVCGRNCLVSELNVMSSFRYFVLSYDVGNLYCRFNGCTVKTIGIASYGISIEGGENSAIIDCVCQGSAVTALFLNSCDQCEVRNCHGLQASIGLTLGANDPTDRYGARGCKVVDCSFVGNSSTGIEIGDGSRDNDLIGVVCMYNGSGGGSQAGIYLNPNLDNNAIPTGIRISGATLVGNSGYGLLVDAATGIYASNISTSGNGTAGGSGVRVRNGGELFINGLQCREGNLGPGSAAVSVEHASTLFISQFAIEASGTAFHDGVVVFDNGASVSLRDGVFRRTVAGPGFCIDLGNATCRFIADTVTGNSSYTSSGGGIYVGTGATVRLNNTSTLMPQGSGRWQLNLSN